MIIEIIEITQLQFFRNNIVAGPIPVVTGRAHKATPVQATEADGTSLLHWAAMRNDAPRVTDDHSFFVFFENCWLNKSVEFHIGFH